MTDPHFSANDSSHVGEVGAIMSAFESILRTKMLPITDRFGYARFGGYSRNDNKFCSCVPARARLKYPCAYKVNPRCRWCGGYGEVPK